MTRTKPWSRTGIAWSAAPPAPAPRGGGCGPLRGAGGLDLLGSGHRSAASAGPAAAVSPRRPSSPTSGGCQRGLPARDGAAGPGRAGSAIPHPPKEARCPCWTPSAAATRADRHPPGPARPSRLGLEEHRTAALVAEKLESLGDRGASRRRRHRRRGRAALGTASARDRPARRHGRAADRGANDIAATAATRAGPDACLRP